MALLCPPIRGFLWPVVPAAVERAVVVTAVLFVFFLVLPVVVEFEEVTWARIRETSPTENHHLPTSTKSYMILSYGTQSAMLDGKRMQQPPKQSHFNQPSETFFLCFGCPSE